MPRARNVGIEVVVVGMARLAMHGGEIEYPISLGVADLCRDRLANVAVHEFDARLQRRGRGLEIGEHDSIEQLALAKPRRQPATDVPGASKNDASSERAHARTAIAPPPPNVSTGLPLALASTAAMPKSSRPGHTNVKAFFM